MDRRRRCSGQAVIGLLKDRLADWRERTCPHRQSTIINITVCCYIYFGLLRIETVSVCTVQVWFGHRVNNAERSDNNAVLLSSSPPYFQSHDSIVFHLAYDRTSLLSNPAVSTKSKSNTLFSRIFITGTQMFNHVCNVHTEYRVCTALRVHIIPPSFFPSPSEPRHIFSLGSRLVDNSEERVGRVCAMVGAIVGMIENTQSENLFWISTGRLYRLEMHIVYRYITRFSLPR